jgi:predicted Ser/Thr protein kinase
VSTPRKSARDGTGQPPSNGSENRPINWSVIAISLPHDLNEGQLQAFLYQTARCGLWKLGSAPESAPVRIPLDRRERQVLLFLEYPTDDGYVEIRRARLDKRMRSWERETGAVVELAGRGEPNNLEILEQWLAPADLRRIEREIDEVIGEFSTPFPVVERLSTGGSAGARSKVELIRFGNDLAVCKTFKRGNDLRLVRELQVLRGCEGCRVVPKLLATGPNWYVVPYFEGARVRDRIGPTGLISLDDAIGVIEAMRELYERGFAHMDLTPDNILIGTSGSAMLIDFEAAHQYEVRPPAFEDSYDIMGPPPGSDAVRDRSLLTYQNRWKPLIGLDLEVLLEGSRLRQRVRRIAYIGWSVPRRAGNWLIRRMGLSRGSPPVTASASFRAAAGADLTTGQIRARP